VFQRHEISRLPAIEGEAGRKKAFKRYPIGYFHIDIAEVRTEEGKLPLFVAIDRCDLPKNRSGPTVRRQTHMFDLLCRAHGIEHRLTKPNHPWTNG